MSAIILISGKAQNGKDALADILTDRLDGEVVKIPFAKYLKQMAMDYFEWDGVKTPQARTFLQKFGTDYVRYELGLHNFWANRVCEDIKVLSPYYDYFIIPDCRFRNELHLVSAMFPDNTTSIRVHRVGFKSPLTLEQQNHPSETDLDDYTFDFNIYAQDGISHLADEADRVLKGKLY